MLFIGWDVRSVTCGTDPDARSIYDPPEPVISLNIQFQEKSKNTIKVNFSVVSLLQIII